MNFTQLFTDANSATGGMYGVVLPFLVMIIAYAGFSAYGFSRALSAAAFIGFLAALPLMAMGLVPDYIMVIFVVITLAASFYLFTTPSRGG
jgi:hypothetical protein